MSASLVVAHRHGAARPGVGLGALAVLAAALLAPAAHAQTRVENPFAGATWYVSPEYAANVASTAAQVSDATVKAKIAKVATYPTAFWMDRTAAIQGSASRMGLAAHLDAALAQQQAGKPVVVIVVIYNLPGRDCSALASNGELGPTDIDKYKTQYIDPIAAIEGNAKYAALRIVNIVELDSLPNLVTNVAGSSNPSAMCDTMKQNGNYVAGVQYALSKLHAAGNNTYNYIDAGHHGWLGWDNNFGPSAQLLADTAKGATGGVDTVQGFITNTANYSALVEPYVTVTDQTRASKWLDWNRYADERSYAVAFRSKLVSVGFNSTIGMLIDTSRNGWGGAARPTKASTATDVNTAINESRVDRRYHAGNWCNQSGAGLGERPQVVGADGIHAYVWVKPPGESDGASKEIANNEGKGFDRMCDPTYGGNGRNGNSPTGALPDAPLAGAWFHAQLIELVQNAYPPVPSDGGTAVGDFTLNVSPASLTVNQGESASSTILVGPTGGFTGAVALTASGLPTGVSAVFSPASTAGQSVVAFTATSSAATGMRTVTITGTSGTLTHSASLYLTVNAAGTATFGLAASPATLSIPRGGSGTSTITITPSNGFSSSVGLTAGGLPAGVTATFSNQAPTASTTVTFAASSSAAVGAATVAIAGTGGNVTKSTAIALTVTDSGGSGSSSGGSSSGGSSSGGNGSSSGGNGSSSGGNGSSSGGNGSSSGGNGSSSGGSGPSSGGSASGYSKSSAGCSTVGGADASVLLLALGALGALRARRRRA